MAAEKTEKKAKAAPKKEAAKKAPKAETKAKGEEKAHEEKHHEPKAEKKPKKAPHPPVEHKPHDEMSCKVGGCKREYRAKGYCRAHYRKWRRGELGKPRYKRCGALNCTEAMVINRHGYCEAHFQQYYVKGEKPAVAPPPAKEEKASEKGAA